MIGRAAAGLATAFAAAAAGAAGLGAEVVLAGWSGLVVGQGRGAALALAAWIAAWALGAGCAAFTRGRSRPLALAGVATSAGIALAWALLRRGAGAPPGDLAAAALVVVAVGLAAFPQGFFLPLLARARAAREVGLLFGANLLGAVVGAHGIGHVLAGAVGRDGALVGACVAALIAGGVGALAARDGGVLAENPAGSPPVPSSPAHSTRHLGAPAAALIAGLGTAWVTGAEWVGLRLGALWFGGLQAALAGVLAGSLVALALGAAVLPRLVPRDGRGPAVMLALAVAGSLWVVLGPGPGVLDDPRGNSFLGSFVHLAPLLAPLGALVPTLHAARPGEPGARLSRLLVHELWGAPLGVLCAHAWLVPRFGCGGTLAALAGVAALGALVSMPQLGRAWSAGLAAAGLAGAVVLARAPEPALASPALDRPDFVLLDFTEDAEFAVSVVRDGLRGGKNLLTDEFRATAVGDDYLYMRVLGHLPLLLHPDPARVAVLAFGTGTTAGAVALHDEVERLEVLEISRAVIEAAPWFEEVNRGVLGEGLPGLLDPDDGRDRVVVRLGDGRRTLARWPAGTLDVLTMEPLLPDSPGAVFLYTDGFYALARRALAPGGLVCQWVPPHALAPETFDAVVAAFTDSFPWSGVFLFGTQVILLGGEAEPVLDGTRFPDEGPLHDALAGLGLEDATGVVARFVAAGDAWPPATRPLRDADPWVLYAERPRGNLALLPTNLAALRARQGEAPLAWRLATGPAGERRIARVRRVHLAAEAWYRQVAEGAGLRLPADAGATPFASLRGDLAGLASEEVEAAVLARRIRFDELLVAGFTALARRDARGALDALTRAAEIRPEHAETHLLIALAAARLGEPTIARAAADRAYELCPRLLETRQGRRAVEVLGLPPELARGRATASKYGVSGS